VSASNKLTWFRRAALFGAVLCSIVVVVGAWVRLTDAGLGCPDWPGCYGAVHPAQLIEKADDVNAAFPERPFDYQKALHEMVHRYIATALGLVIIGLAVFSWRNRRDPDLLRRTCAAAAPALAALLLLFWQTRTGPAAQMLAAVGAVAIVWVLAPWFDRARNAWVRTFGVVAIALIGFGAVVPLGLKLAPPKASTERDKKIEKANRLCNFIGSYRPVAKQPKGVVFTFLDYSPRLITLTHHDAIMGPYHRNGEQIADVMKAFRGSADNARRTFAKYDADYLLTCPHSSTTTIFMAEAPKGFYAQLARGQVPPWLTPVELPSDSPFRMWRISPAPEGFRDSRTHPATVPENSPEARQ